MASGPAVATMVGRILISAWTELVERLVVPAVAQAGYQVAATSEWPVVVMRMTSFF